MNRGPRLISESIPRLTEKVFSRKYLMLGRLVTRWTDIVGKDLSTKAQPIKIRTMRPKKKGDRPIATLDIATNTADATLLHYQKDLILERINQIFGANWITAIRFVPQASNTASTVNYKRRTKPLTASEKEYLATALDGIKDEDLEKRLAKLGAAILQERE